MDTISDMIIRLKNAVRAGHAEVLVPYSALRFAIATKLKERGFLDRVERGSKKDSYTFAVEIAKDDSGAFKITDVARLSRPSARRYLGKDALYPVRNGRGILMLSTPQGVMTGDEAKKTGVGGEALFELW